MQHLLVHSADCLLFETVCGRPTCICPEREFINLTLSGAAPKDWDGDLETKGTDPFYLRQVACLTSGRMAPGTHVLHWRTSAQPGGVYFCRTTNGSKTSVVKMVVVK